jgi:hypothetical protein
VKYKAFISYKHRVSTEFTDNLELALKTYAKPIWRPPIAIFRDEKYLKPGLDLPTMIKGALEQSEFLIYIASTEAAASAWVQDELSQWSSGSRLERLIIVLTEGTIAIDETSKAIDWEKTNAVPDVLRPSLSKVPFYVDGCAFNAAARQTLLDPDFKKLVNSITASLRRIDPIEMSGQEIIQHRKNLRNRNLLLSSVVLTMLVAAGGVGIAIQQRNAANQQRTIALARQLAARSRGILEREPYKIESAVLLAAESLKRWPSSDADEIVRQGISLLPDRIVDLEHKAGVVKATLSPDASSLVTVSDGRVYIWELSEVKGAAQRARELDLRRPFHLGGVQSGISYHSRVAIVADHCPG